MLYFTITLMLFSRAKINTGNIKTITVLLCLLMILRALKNRFHFRNPVVVNQKNIIPVVFIVENVLAIQHPNEKVHYKKTKITNKRKKKLKLCLITILS